MHRSDRDRLERARLSLELARGAVSEAKVAIQSCDNLGSTALNAMCCNVEDLVDCARNMIIRITELAAETAQ